MAGIRYKGQIFSGTASFGDADHVAYDNTQSGLAATDVQGAEDELNASKADNNDSGTGYCKMPDGTMVMYGTVLCNSGSATNVSFGSNFNSEPSAFTSYIGSANVTVHITSCDKNGMDITASATSYIKWLALGRWK